MGTSAGECSTNSNPKHGKCVGSGNCCPSNANLVVPSSSRTPPKHYDTCRFTVTVLDEEDPVIHNCPDNIIQGTDNDERYATVTWTHPTASDNVGFMWRKVRRDRNETTSTCLP